MNSVAGMGNLFQQVCPLTNKVLLTRFPWQAANSYADFEIANRLNIIE
jgi:hypothetical protein